MPVRDMVELKTTPKLRITNSEKWETSVWKQTIYRPNEILEMF